MFQNNPRVEWTGPGVFFTCRELVCEYKGRVHRVPAGFLTDLASVPRFLRDRKSFDQNGPSFPGAILHDYMYATGEFGKEYADEVFYAALLSKGMSQAAAWAHFKGVDWFGFHAFNQHRRKRVEAAQAGKPYPVLVAVL